MPLRVDYDLSRVRLSLPDLRNRSPSLWRYREVLPLEEGDETSLGEGMTPLLPVQPNVWVKDESRNPTGSFKARGMAVASDARTEKMDDEARKHLFGQR